MEQFFLTTLILRLGKWAIRNAFKILLIIVLVSFLLWLIFIKLGYGSVLDRYVGYFIEFCEYIKGVIYCD